MLVERPHRGARGHRVALPLQQGRRLPRPGGRPVAGRPGHAAVRRRLHRAHPAWHVGAGPGLPPAGADGETADHAGHALGRARDPGRRRGLDARGVRRAGDAVRPSRRASRRDAGGVRDAVHAGATVVRRPLLSLRRVTVQPQAGQRSHPDLGRGRRPPGAAPRCPRGGCVPRRLHLAREHRGAVGGGAAAGQGSGTGPGVDRAVGAHAAAVRPRPDSRRRPPRRRGAGGGGRSSAGRRWASRS